MPVVRDTRTLVHVPEDVHAWLNTLLDGTQKVNAAGPGGWWWWWWDVWW